jgi:hypothetical protein
LTHDPAAIGALFAEDATYAYHPYNGGDEVVRGRKAIVADWLEERDDPGTWEASYRPLVDASLPMLPESIGAEAADSGDARGLCGWHHAYGGKKHSARRGIG